MHSYFIQCIGQRRDWQFVFSLAWEGSGRCQEPFLPSPSHGSRLEWLELKPGRRTSVTRHWPCETAKRIIFFFFFFQV